MILMAREFLMLAHVYDPKKHSPAAWLVSEKLDGMRAYWDGGITRGKLAEAVPWANTAKNARYVLPMYATGLWSRYGHPIQAPGWFLERLPDHPLDGELWLGRKKFQLVMSTVKDLVPGPVWNKIEYRVFDAPSYMQVFSNGEIKIKKKYEKKFFGILEWIQKGEYNGDWLHPCTPYISTLKWLKNNLPQHANLVLHEQEVLPFDQEMALHRLETILSGVVALGGEGVMLRKPTSLWAPSRTWSMLKYKPFLDSEAEVRGFTWGRETEEGSKLLGKMGAMIVQWKGKTFKLSGFTDEEREVIGPNPLQEGMYQQGETNASWHYKLKHFQYGDIVSFSYRELSDDGIPKEARYLRKDES